MKYHYEGTNPLSFDGILLMPGLNNLSKEHNEKLSAHPKFIAMKKAGIVSDVVNMSQAKAEKLVESGEATIPTEAVKAEVKLSKKK